MFRSRHISHSNNKRPSTVAEIDETTENGEVEFTGKGNFQENFENSLSKIFEANGIIQRDRRLKNNVKVKVKVNIN